MATTFPTGYRLMRALGRLNRWVTHEVPSDVPAAQLRLLALISELGRTRVGELAAADHCTQPTMTTQLNKLQRAGLVARRPDPSDARAQRVELTSAGADVLDRTRAARGQFLDAELGRCPASQREDLLAAVDTLERLLGQLSHP